MRRATSRHGVAILASRQGPRARDHEVDPGQWLLARIGLECLRRNAAQPRGRLRAGSPRSRAGGTRSDCGSRSRARAAPRPRRAGSGASSGSSVASARAASAHGPQYVAAAAPGQRDAVVQRGARLLAVAASRSSARPSAPGPRPRSVAPRAPAQAPGCACCTRARPRSARGRPRASRGRCSRAARPAGHRDAARFRRPRWQIAIAPRKFVVSTPACPRASAGRPAAGSRSRAARRARRNGGSGRGPCASGPAGTVRRRARPARGRCPRAIPPFARTRAPARARRGTLSSSPRGKCRLPRSVHRCASRRGSASASAASSAWRSASSASS